MKTTLTLVAVTALMLAAVVACSKKDDKADKPSETSTTSATVVAKASCNMQSELATCNEYRTGTTLGFEKSLCESFKGKFANAGCSTDGKVAGDHALTLEEAKRDCDSESVRGKFTVDPKPAKK